MTVTLLKEAIECGTLACSDLAPYLAGRGDKRPWTKEGTTTFTSTRTRRSDFPREDMKQARIERAMLKFMLY